MDKVIQGLLDKQAIGETISRLFIGTDRRDWETVKVCRADEVLFDMSWLAGGKPATLSG